MIRSQQNIFIKYWHKTILRTFFSPKLTQKILLGNLYKSFLRLQVFTKGVFWTKIFLLLFYWLIKSERNKKFTRYLPFYILKVVHENMRKLSTNTVCLKILFPNVILQKNVCLPVALISTIKLVLF